MYSSAILLLERGKAARQAGKQEVILLPSCNAMSPQMHLIDLKIFNMVAIFACLFSSLELVDGDVKEKNYQANFIMCI